MVINAFNLLRITRHAQIMSVLMALSLFLSARSLHAESTNKRMILPGLKAQALGGAFTAIADDASAGWYNPAGLGFLRGQGVSVTANNYSRTRKEASEIAPNTRFSENSSSLYPGFAGSHASLGPFTFGWSYFTLEQQNIDESQSIELTNSDSASPFRYERTEITAGSLIHAGATLAMALGKNLSLGVSEFYYRRQKQTALKERSRFNTGVFYDSFVRQSTINEGTVSVAGLLLRGGSLSLGLAIKVPTALSDVTDLETGSIIYTGSSPELSATKDATHREDELIVRTWSAGLSWTPDQKIVISLDAIHYPATTSPWLQAGGFDTKQVTDWSIGAEIALSPVILTGGFFTNSSLVRTPVPSLVDSQPASTDYVGFSTGLGWRTKQSDSMLIMVRQRGKGKTQLVKGELSIQETNIDTQSFSIGSKYNF